MRLHCEISINISIFGKHVFKIYVILLPRRMNNIPHFSESDHDMSNKNYSYMTKVKRNEERSARVKFESRY